MFPRTVAEVVAEARDQLGIALDPNSVHVCDDGHVRVNGDLAEKWLLARYAEAGLA